MVLMVSSVRQENGDAIKKKKRKAAEEEAEDEEVLTNGVDEATPSKKKKKKRKIDAVEAEPEVTDVTPAEKKKKKKKRLRMNKLVPSQWTYELFQYCTVLFFVSILSVGLVVKMFVSRVQEKRCIESCHVFCFFHTVLLYFL